MKRLFYIIPLIISVLCLNAEASRLKGLLGELPAVTSRSLSRTLLRHYDPNKFPSSVKIVEVSPRDGLQNETVILPVNERLVFIDLLEKAGLRSIEGGAFVNPKRVPQMAGSGRIAELLHYKPSVSYSFLVPNRRGLEEAMKMGVTDIAVFTSPSEQFTQRNIGMSVKESLENQGDVTRRAIAHGMRVRGYVSCVMGCPYDVSTFFRTHFKLLSEFFHTPRVTGNR